MLLLILKTVRFDFFGEHITDPGAALVVPGVEVGKPLIYFFLSFRCCD